MSRTSPLLAATPPCLCLFLHRKEKTAPSCKRSCFIGGLSSSLNSEIIISGHPEAPGMVGGSWWRSSSVSSQGDVYSRCPVFCQASPGVFMNSLVSVTQLLPGTGKMAGADGVLALQESGRKVDVRAVKCCTDCRGDLGYTLPGTKPLSCC